MDRPVAQERLNLIKIARSLAVLWVVLSLADAGITYVCLQDIANIEGNPFARALLSYHEALFYGAKLLVTICIGIGLWWLAARTSYLKAMIACQLILILLFVGVLSSNLLHL